MQIIYQILSMLTTGNFGAIITIAIIVITAVAITRQWEKAMLLLFPLTIGYTTIGLGAGNWIIGVFSSLTILIYISNILYENRLLGSKLSSKGMGFFQKQLKEVAKATRKISKVGNKSIKETQQYLKKKAKK